MFDVILNIATILLSVITIIIIIKMWRNREGKR